MLSKMELEKNLIESLVDGLVVIDRDSIIVFANQPCHKIFGYPGKSLLGKNIKVLMRPCDHKLHDENLKEFRATGKSRIITNGPVEVKGVKKDGTEIDLELANTARVLEGKPVVVSSVRDITNRKLVEKKSKETEELLELLAQSCNDIVLLRDAEGRVIYISPALKRHLDREPEDYIGKPIWGFLHPDECKRLPAWKRQIQKEGGFQARARLKHKDGHYIWFESISEAIKDKTGRVTSVVTEMRNISKLRKAEDESMRFGRIIENSKNEIYVLDAKTLKFAFVNQGAKENLGYSISELKNMTPMDISPGFSRKKIRKMLVPLLSGKTERISLEASHKRKNGTCYDTHVTLHLSKTQDEELIVANVDDITQQKIIESEAKLTEERFKLLAEYGDDIIFLRDAKGKVLYVSPSIKKHLGVDPSKKAGKTAWHIVHPDDQDDSRTNWNRCVNEGVSYTWRGRLKHADGSDVWFESKTEPVKDNDGNVTAVVTAARNITKQREAEDVSTRFGRIIENSLNEIYVFDEQTLEFVFANLGARENLGYSMDELSKLTPLDLKPAFTKRSFNKMVDPLRHGEITTLAFETMYRRKDGSQYDVDARLHLSRTGDQHVFVAIIEDITEKKQDKAKAKEAEDRFRMLTEYGHDMVFQRDPNSNLVYVSPSIKRHLGHDPENLIGGSSEVILHPDDHHLLTKWKKAVFSEGKPFHSIARLKHTDGGYRWVESYTEPISGENGKIVSAVTTSRDVTEQKQAREENLQLAKILENSLNEIYVIDPKTGQFIYSNRRAQENLGYTLEELQKMSPNDIADKHSPKEIKGLFETLMNGDSDIIQFEGRNRRKDGSLYDIEIRLQLSQTRGDPVFVAIIDDITEKKVAAEKLRQAQKMEAVGLLTGGIAHDFNNLLTSVLGSLRLLESENISDEGQEFLELATKSTQRGAELTHRLLSFSRKQPLEPRQVEIDKLVSGLETLLQRTLGETIGVNLQTKGKNHFAVIDPSEFENAILNLAINARDAMPSGGELYVDVRGAMVSEKQAEGKDYKPGRYVLTTIKDTGIGMPEDVLNNAFDPFFTTKPVGEGSGLGLSMVFGFVKQSQGFIKIESDPGVGTTIDIYLPAQSARPKAKAAPKPLRKAKQDTGQTLLFVDEDEGTRTFAHRALSAQGYHVMLAKDGAGALKQIKEAEKIDLLIADSTLPDGDRGENLAKNFTSRFSDGKVLMCSFLEDKPNDASVAPGNDVLAKPYELTALLMKVGQMLDGPVPPRI